MDVDESPTRNASLNMIVLHANWFEGRLALWAESIEGLTRSAQPLKARHAVGAPGDDDSDELLDSDSGSQGLCATLQDEAVLSSVQLRAALVDQIGVHAGDLGADSRVRLLLPGTDEGPMPSPQARSSAALDLDDETVLHLVDAEFDTVTVEPIHVLRVLSALDQRLDSADGSWRPGTSLTYWIRVGRFVTELLVSQRFIPTMSQELGGRVTGHWRLWAGDHEHGDRLSVLVRQMPGAARCAVHPSGQDAWTILDEMMSATTDAVIREIFAREQIVEAIEDRDLSADDHVAWLACLVDRDPDQKLGESHAVQLMRHVRTWLSRLSDVGAGQPFHLRLELVEPALGDDKDDFLAPDREVAWPMTFWLESAEDDSVRISADDIWATTGDVMLGEGLRLENPQDRLVQELRRAAALFAPLERALDEARPSAVGLSTAEAYSLLRESRPVLEESGFSVVVPEWWDRPQTRLAARLCVHSEDLGEDEASGFATMAGEGALGLDTIVDYQWQVLVGGHVLSREEFERLSRIQSPLVRLRGEWVELRESDIVGARKYWDQVDGGQMTLRDALRVAYGAPRDEHGMAVLGIEADGWVGRVFGASADGSTTLPMLPQPKDFIGHLRPYQVTGLSWLAFLERFGLGTCLADDMGLGKTIQLIALLLAERENGRKSPGPTMLVAPTSVVGNWVHELRRFAPNLRVAVHHGIDRASGAEFEELVSEHDVVITTYALAYRDREELSRVKWWRICLDEAQNIKNPTAKQTIAIRSFMTDRRVALTGTPVENRLSELWSIMDFLNPGYLGSSQQFRRRFALNIERYRDAGRIEQLRHLIQPFILRRLKTDPNVIADLPEKQEYKVYCTLTPEQVRLYESIVQSMLRETTDAQGMRRRSLILAALVKLKQVCNHPGHYLREQAGDATKAVSPARSGKAARLIAMLEEVVAEGDSALVFTQFRQMGHLLAAMIRKELGVEVLFLHGGSPMKKREEMIERFQQRDGTAPVFVLSLKAGGFGLNLTAANHVFHYDRWWNPAVENQATDRAFRIGQTRSVQVHKYVCSGTLEERVDQMIEQKVELAQNVIGSGEQWLTELSTDQLKQVLSLSYEDANPTHARDVTEKITAADLRSGVAGTQTDDSEDDTTVISPVQGGADDE